MKAQLIYYKTMNLGGKKCGVCLYNTENTQFTLEKIWDRLTKCGNVLLCIKRAWERRTDCFVLAAGVGILPSGVEVPSGSDQLQT